MQKTILIPVANDVEDIETVVLIDVLRRAEAQVIVAGIAEREIVAVRQTHITADKLLVDCVDMSFDLIAVPGGMPGAEHLRDSELLTSFLKQQQEKGGLYAGICAAPVVVLQHHGLLEGKKATCHPAMISQLQNAINDRVVVDTNVITSQGPGTALEFALVLVELLYDQETADKIAQAMVVKS
ncbi:MAG: DJ-1/PfpI family protein [Gammaproteobacteria bacterium]|nr:DJ-1/PfpI family protein [Gammaproteobacteria bacterium]